MLTGFFRRHKKPDLELIAAELDVAGNGEDS